MTTLAHRRYTTAQLRELIERAPADPAQLNDEHRRSLSARFRAVPGTTHRHLDAWSVESAGQSPRAFRWTPQTARRTLGNAAVRRLVEQPHQTLRDAVEWAISDQLLRAASGRTRAGSLAHWLAHAPAPVLGLVTGEALNWSSSVLEAARPLEMAWHVARSDAYYDVAAARTSLRARRDLVVAIDPLRVIVRLRGGAPGKSAGPGLRADLTIATLADPEGVAPARIIGLWPDAGVCLAVDGTIADLRAGARDLVRTAVVQARLRAPRAA